MSTQKDLELIVSNYVRKHYEQKYHKQYIATVLKHLIVKYCKMMITSKILSFRQDLELYQLLNTKLLNITKIELLYRASDNYYSSKRFHSLCDQKGRTITIAKMKSGNIIGGYTSKWWTANEYGTYIKDEKAFLFLVESGDNNLQSKCPLIFDIKQNDNSAIYCDVKQGPIFVFASYDYGDLKAANLYGGNDTLRALDYEVLAL